MGNTNGGDFVMTKNNYKRSIRKLVEDLREHLTVDLKYTASSLHIYAAPWKGIVWFARIFRSADDMRYDRRSPKLHLTTPVIVKTLYSTGMRISEVLSLKKKDVDFLQNSIMARDTKGGKERLLPMSNSLASVYKEYCEKVRLSATDNMFTTKTGAPIPHPTFYHTFRRLLEKSNIPYMGRGRGPRIHDFRHTMAVHRLNQWSAEQKDITAMLPILAVYLGHENVRIVSYYLRLTAQVYPEVTAQVERNFGEVIPDIISKEWEALKDYD
jgi:integrase